MMVWKYELGEWEEVNWTNRFRKSGWKEARHRLQSLIRKNLSSSCCYWALPPSMLNCLVICPPTALPEGIPVSIFQMSKQVQIEEVTWQSHTDQKKLRSRTKPPGLKAALLSWAVNLTSRGAWRWNRCLKVVESPSLKVTICQDGTWQMEGLNKDSSVDPRNKGLRLWDPMPL